MGRVTGTEVKAIFDTTLSASELDPFITAANLMVTSRLGGEGLAAATLKEVERWLAAHFASANDQRVSSEKLGDASNTYQGQTGMNLDATHYGQYAKMLDPTGKLARSGKPGGRVKVLGPKVE